MLSQEPYAYTVITGQDRALFLDKSRAIQHAEKTGSPWYPLYLHPLEHMQAMRLPASPYTGPDRRRPG